MSFGKDVVTINDLISIEETDELFKVNLIGVSTDENNRYLEGVQIEIDNIFISKAEAKKPEQSRQNHQNLQS